RSSNCTSVTEGLTPGASNLWHAKQFLSVTDSSVRNKSRFLNRREYASSPGCSHILNPEAHWAETDIARLHVATYRSAKLGRSAKHDQRSIILPVMLASYYDSIYSSSRIYSAGQYPDRRY